MNLNTIWDGRYLAHVQFVGSCFSIVVKQITDDQPGIDTTQALANFDNWAQSRGCVVFKVTPDFLVLARHFA